MQENDLGFREQHQHTDTLVPAAGPLSLLAIILWRLAGGRFFSSDLSCSSLIRLAKDGMGWSSLQWLGGRNANGARSRYTPTPHPFVETPYKVLKTKGMTLLSHHRISVPTTRWPRVDARVEIMGRNGKDKRDMFYRKAKEVSVVDCAIY